MFKFGYLHNCHFNEKIIRRYSFDRLDVKFGDSKRLEEIIGIYETNKFNGGVGIQASRLKSLMSEATPLQTQSLVILLDCRHPRMLCLSLPSGQKVQERDFQNEFSIAHFLLK